jgi:futalosine hydrolase
MKPIIVTAATCSEISLLISRLEGVGRITSGQREIHEGMIAGRRAILAVTGIGKVNTASTVTALLEHHEPELLINTGCAGAYPGGGLAVGDLAIATAEVFGDEGVVTTDGWHSLKLIGIPALSRNGESYFNRFPLTRWAIDKAMHVAEAEGITLHQGEFVTVSTASGRTERGKELSQRFGAICENMEGAAAAQVALLYGVDCMEVRGVSNMVENRDLSRWDIPLAVERAQSFILQFIAALCRLY